MSPREIVVLTDVSLVTCIVETGLADSIVSAARGAGAQGATIHHARGLGVRERLGLLGITIDAEKEVVQFVVPSDVADAVLRAVVVAGKLDTPGKGLAHVMRLEKVATHVPPDVLDRVMRRR